MPKRNIEDNISFEVEEPTEGVLYIVSTPIGNFEDITLRALRILKSCDIVICEEIKEAAILMKRLNITKKLETLNEQDEMDNAAEYIGWLREGKKLALISDAGTPIFADPGLYFVRLALEEGFNIEVVPGASSIMTALVRSGFSLDQFLFAGFMSRQPDERIHQLRELSKESRTVVFLETPYRLMAILEAANVVMPERQAYIGINLTMPYETHHYGSFRELYDRFSESRFRGEFVICFEGKEVLRSEEDGNKRISRSDSRPAKRIRKETLWQ
jgi:16S rRNA (cytidine1402-2'-O)-methyltransferase